MSFFNKYKVSKPNCPKCGLDTGCISPRMRFTGEGKKGILIIADAPTENDDQSGEQLSDYYGALLKSELKPLGINLDRDCWKSNSINCHPGKDNKDLTKKEQTKYTECCKPFLDGIIKETKPKKIFLIGDIAVNAFYKGRCDNIVSSAYHFQGLKFWDSKHNAWVFPLWSPDFLKKKEKDRIVQAVFKRCLKRAVEADPEPLNKVWNNIHLLRDFKHAVECLKKVLRYEKTIAIDFETTGLTIYKPGHKTVSFSWATEEGAWAVPVEHPYWTDKQQVKIKSLVGKILKKKKIKKIVQGIKFEYPWTKQQFGVEPENFFWDTQLASHFLDNRRGVIGLKFQSFMRWGIEDYDNTSKGYIETDPKTGFNRMLHMPVDSLLKYNALDTLYTYELYKEQVNEFEEKEFEPYNFLLEGAKALCEMSFNGIKINIEYYEEARKELEAESNQLIKELYQLPDVKKYQKRYGAFDYNSTKDLRLMLFEVMKLEAKKETATGLKSTDEEVLTKIDSPLTSKIIKIRKINKMITTYVDGFIRATYDGFMHPSFSLATTVSYRSSSSEPNFQNVPKRDPKAKKVTRSGMVPRPGRVLGEMDFSGAEISTSCFYHKDPTFIEYQTNPEGGDMHRDAAAHILKIKPDEVPGEVRQCTKAVWTFKQFYGGYYVSSAKQGWEEYPLVVNKEGDEIKIKGKYISQHLKQTFSNYKAFESHLKAFEHTFWYDWFPVYTEWKDKIVDFYIENGYVETFFGFRFRSYMDKKQCTNYPIQGTSFHLLLYTIIEFWKRSKEMGLKTLIIGQIHDSLILDIPVEEIDIVKELVADIVGNLHNVFKWMTIPMELDLELSETAENGGSFAKLEKVKL